MRDVFGVEWNDRDTNETQESSLMVFEGYEVEIFELDGIVYFNPRHVGNCLDISLEGVKSALKKMSSKQVTKLTNKDIQNSKGLTNTFRKLHNTGENFLTESGVYKLIFKSRKESAERFQDWVTDEVLPQIRKTGAYNQITEKDRLMLDLFSNNPMIVAHAHKQLVSLETKPLKDKIEIDAPKVEFAETVSFNKNAISIGEYSNVLFNYECINIGRTRLFKWLRDMGYLMGNNRPYQKYLDNGFFLVRELVVKTPRGEELKVQPLITGKGQSYITKRIAKKYK